MTSNTTYHLSIDSGGSKIKAVLYNGAFEPISHAKTGSVRGNSTPRNLIDLHLQEMLSQLFDEHPEVQRVETIHGSFGDRLLVESLKTRVSLAEDAVQGDGEGGLGLASAGLKAPGLVCLSGTGATMFFLGANGQRYGAMGGYGAVVFDEGSGYHIGRLGISAAIRAFEKRGAETLLEPMISEYLGRDKLNAAIFYGIYDAGKAPIAAVAGLCPVVCRAAWLGDNVALDILNQAGCCLGDQMNALIRREQVPQEVPMTISGSTYRGHPAIFDSLCREIRKENPERPIIKPLFEPVVGGIIRHWLSLGREFDEETRKMFLERYADYRFTVGERPADL